MDKILEGLKWFVTLTGKEILKVILILVFAAAGYYIYRQEQQIAELNVPLDTLTDRYDTDTALLQKGIDDCTQKRFEEVEKISKYYREEYESLKERADRNYRNIKEIKDNG